MLQKTGAAVDWVLGMAAASQVRAMVLLARPIPGADELEEAAKGLLRFIHESVPFFPLFPFQCS